jgi:hypothetical protein
MPASSAVGSARAVLDTIHAAVSPADSCKNSRREAAIIVRIPLLKAQRASQGVNQRSQITISDNARRSGPHLMIIARLPPGKAPTHFALRGPSGTILVARRRQDYD